MTNDLQPMVIYRKSYGSCGEQSILQTALCRAFFIPSFPVGCRGEDHQWNHCLEPVSGQWKHWDINNGLAGLGDLWVSGEGPNHQGKTISTITAFDPDGRVRSVTDDVIVPAHSGYMEGNKGYTRTATVDITVIDPSERPVEGALVLVKSHWNNADAITAFDYTDKDGFCSFELGWQVNGGYAFDIISPFGSGGTTAIAFSEDSSYTLKYIIPYIQPAEQIIATAGDASSEVNVVNNFYPIPYFSRSLYSIATDTTGVINKTSWVKWSDLTSVENLLYMDSENFSKFRDGYNCNASLQPFNPEVGDNCYVVLNNKNSLFTWAEFSMPENRVDVDMSADIDISATSSNREPVSGISLPIAERNVSAGGANWVQYYENMEITQDNPDDPLSSELVIGPFTIPSDERSINIATLCETAGLDLDLFLFMDKNSNRLLDGMSELLLSSATPSGNEQIFINNPDTDNIYWLYLQGWQVNEGGDLVDLGLSFTPEPISIHALSPTGFVTEIPDTFSFEFIDELHETADVRIGGISAVAEMDESQIYHFTLPEIASLINEASLKVFSENNEMIEALNWELLIDSISPTLVYDSEPISPSEMVYKAKIHYFDLESGIETVSVSVDSTFNKVIDMHWCPEETTVEIDLLERAGESVTVTFSVKDIAGNLTEEFINFDVPERSEVVFSSFYPRRVSYNHRPIFQALTHLAIDGEMDMGNYEALLTLSTSTSEIELRPYIIDGDLIQFSAQDYLENGHYTATIQLFNVNGELISQQSWNFQISTMTSTTGRNR